MKTGSNGSSEAIRTSVEASYEVFNGIKIIDIFECARIDLHVFVRISIRVLVSLVEEGKIGGVGFNEVGAGIIRKAHVIQPISAVEIELCFLYWTYFIAV